MMAPGNTDPPLALALNLRTLVFKPPLPPDVNPELGGLVSLANIADAAAFPTTAGAAPDRPDCPGTIPVPVRRAINARIAPSHLISSSSPGAHRSSVRLVVTILNV